MKRIPKIAVSGAAGQISYALLFRIASGGLFAAPRKLRLAMLEVPIDPAVKVLNGVAMELDDCAFPQLDGFELHTDAAECFAGADVAFLVGARPRGRGMERKDLLHANAQIFSAQGQALAKAASKNVKVLVVGNPANTNCLIAQRNAPSLDPANFSAMTRLDHNRSIAQVASRAKCAVGQVAKVTIWGNHSSTQFPDLAHATVAGQPALKKVGRKWYEQTMIADVQQRGAAIINARGASSAASAASAALDHMRDWISGSKRNNWVSMAVVSNGEYGINPGLVYSYPVRCSDGKWKIVPDLKIGKFARAMMKASERELQEECDAVAQLLP